MAFRERSKLRDSRQDAKEQKRERLDAAFAIARKLQASDTENLKRKGVRKEDIKDQIGTIGEYADNLLRNHSDLVDRLVAERREQLPELAARRNLKSQKRILSLKRLEGMADEFSAKLQRKRESSEKTEDVRSHTKDKLEKSPISERDPLTERKRGRSESQERPRKMSDLTSSVKDSIEQTQQKKERIEPLENTVHRTPIETLEEVRRLYFEDGLTQKQVANKLGYESASPVRRIFREMGWTPRYVQPSVRAREDLNDEEVRRLYFDEALTQREVAQRLGTSTRILRKIFREHGWKTHHDPLMRFIKTMDTGEDVPDSKSFEAAVITSLNDSLALAKEVHRLYFEEGLSQEQVAERLGYQSASPIRRIFKENSWQVRLSIGAGTRKRSFKSEEERNLAKLESSERTHRKIVELREELFGTQCRVCGEERKLAIHRKDGAEHDENALWRISYLQSLDSVEWAALCIPCHRGTQWMLEKHGVQYDDLEQLAEETRHSEPEVLDPFYRPGKNTPSSARYNEIRPHFEGSTKELRMTLFGENCYSCSVHYEEKTLVIHRKDGRPHHPKLLEHERYFRTLDPREWVSLCRKCHRYVHWTMDNAGLKWSDLY
jgi:DNA-directed RNA polymerase specialized sigma subunit